MPFSRSCKTLGIALNPRLDMVQSKCGIRSEVVSYAEAEDLAEDVAKPDRELLRRCEETSAVQPPYTDPCKWLSLDHLILDRMLANRLELPGHLRQGTFNNDARFNTLKEEQCMVDPYILE
ncbi:hypothetical protein RJZ57_001766 [Blastomyces gilchristii]